MKIDALNKLSTSMLVVTTYESIIFALLQALFNLFRARGSPFTFTLFFIFISFTK